MVHVLLKLGLENFEHYFTSVWDECNCAVVWAFFGIAFLWDWNEDWSFPVLWPLLSFPNLLAYWVTFKMKVMAKQRSKRKKKKERKKITVLNLQPDYSQWLWTACQSFPSISRYDVLKRLKIVLWLWCSRCSLSQKNYFKVIFAIWILFVPRFPLHQSDRKCQNKFKILLPYRMSLPKTRETFKSKLKDWWENLHAEANMQRA